MNSEIVAEGVAIGVRDAVQELQRESYLPTLRDLFAAAALQGLLASETDVGGFTFGPLEDVSRFNRFERAAKFAYAHADAMIQARGVPGGGK